MKKVLLLSLSFFLTVFVLAQPHLFGTTQQGGFMGDGVVYSYDVATKTYTKVVEFYTANGREPVGKLVLGPDHKIYGATAGGGPFCVICVGVIYSIDPLTNQFHIVYPIGGKEISTGQIGKPIPGQLIVASPTLFYASNDTAIYKFNTTTQNFDKIYSFDPGNTSERFLGSLTVANDGKLYGIRAAGLNNYVGELISFDPNTNIYQVEYKFDQGPVVGTTNGTFPNGDLLLGPNGLLYGSTSDGGTPTGHGVIFTFDPVASTYSVKYTFPIHGPNGDRPYGPLQMGVDGKMYGFTSIGGAYDWGTAFSFSPATNTVTKLADLDDEYVGTTNFRNMLIASDGNFYATTREQGATNQGTLFTYLPSTRTFQTLLDFDADKGKFPVGESLVEMPVEQTITCPGSQDITAGPNCATVVTGIDPVVFPASAQVSYTLLNYGIGGDTIGKGMGSVSGMSFNRFHTEVVYSLVDEPNKKCSFIVSVLDKTPPVLTVPDSIFHCYDDMTAPGSNKYTVPTAHAVENCAPAIAYRYNVKNSRGVILRTGYTSDASGRFEEGRNTVEWAVSELDGGSLGHTAYDTTIVMINPGLTANFTVVRPVTKGVAANTLYLGYAPRSTARMEVTARSGAPAYTYQWSASGNAVSFTVDPKNPTFIYLTARQVGTSSFTAVVTDSKGCQYKLSRTFTVQDVRCGTSLDKVLVCRPATSTTPAQTDCVLPSAVAAILNSGGSLGACSVSAVTMNNATPMATDQGQNEITIVASPNPSVHEFTLTITSNRREAIRLRITDELGRVVEQREGVLPGSTIRIGAGYHRGLYICEAEQNGSRKQIRLMKQGD